MADRRVLLFNGESFEYVILDVLQAAFPDAILLHDKRAYSTYLDKETQIDVIAILPFGVFVIEAKNWKSWICGEYDDVMWNGKSRDNKVITVFNPVHQNFIHVRALRNRIRSMGGCPPYYYNLVVVPDGTAIKSKCKEIVNLSVLANEIRRIGKQKIDVNENLAWIEQATGGAIWAND